MLSSYLSILRQDDIRKSICTPTFGFYYVFAIDIIYLLLVFGVYLFPPIFMLKVPKKGKNLILFRAIKSLSAMTSF